MQEPGDQAHADEQDEQHEDNCLAEGDAQVSPVRSPVDPARAGSSTRIEHRRQILHNHPANGHLSMRRVQQGIVHQPAQQYDRAGNRDRQPQHDPGRHRPAPQTGKTQTQQRGDNRHPPKGAGDGDVAHTPQVGKGEMKADAEHEEDDAQLGQLTDGLRVADEARGEGTDNDAGQQVADDRGQVQADADSRPPMNATTRAAAILTSSGSSCIGGPLDQAKYKAPYRRQQEQPLYRY